MKKNWNEPTGEFDLEDKYQWYLLHNRWRVIIFNKTYDNDDFKEFTDKITKEKEAYIYIHNKLTGDKKMEFKCDYLDRLEFLKSKQIHTKFIVYLDSYILELEEKTNNITNYKAGQFNDFTFNLFTYILNEYPTDGNIKYINIWYFLKRDIKSKENILFNFTQKEFTTFVKKEYGNCITKFQKATFKYQDSELGILQNIATTYRNNLHKVENT